MPGASGAYWHSFETLQARAEEARALGATELCIQGGLNPEARLEGSALHYYQALLEALARRLRGCICMPFLLRNCCLSRSRTIPLQTVIEGLIASGLGSIPGTAAEVLSEPVQSSALPGETHGAAMVCRGAAGASQWFAQYGNPDGRSSRIQQPIVLPICSPWWLCSKRPGSISKRLQ